MPSEISSNTSCSNLSHRFYSYWKKEPEDPKRIYNIRASYKELFLSACNEPKPDKEWIQRVLFYDKNILWEIDMFENYPIHHIVNHLAWKLPPKKKSGGNNDGRYTDILFLRKFLPVEIAEFKHKVLDIISAMNDDLFTPFFGLIVGELQRQLILRGLIVFILL